MPIRDLASHQARYVTIAELAEYWGVSRQQIYKRIDSGALEAIQLGSRLVRVRTAAALEYERSARVGAAARGSDRGASSRTDKLPKAIGLKRVVQEVGRRMTYVSLVSVRRRSSVLVKQFNHVCDAQICLVPTGHARVHKRCFIRSSRKS